MNLYIADLHFGHSNIISHDHRPFADADTMDKCLIDLWNGYFHGSWHIYGHIHASRNEAYEFMRTKERALNAGCMINDYTPASFNELIRNNRIFRERTGK